MARMVVSLGVCLVMSLVSAQKSEDCDVCNRGNCPVVDPVECQAGIIRDRCECCQVCARAEREDCDLGGAEGSGKHGACGDNLVCRAAPGGGGQAGVGMCQCARDDVICGTDGVTYDNLCELVAASHRNQDLSLKEESTGRCFAGK
jgi:hypothetical protein